MNNLWIDEVVRLYFEGYSIKAALAKTKVMKADYEQAFNKTINRRL